jgi:hypothetical protein
MYFGPANRLPVPEYREVPISMIDRESLIPFRLHEYADLDTKGGPKYVRQLSDLMRSCTPLPPAHGYVCTTGPRKGKAICLLDGHHRTNAALWAKVGTVPVIVWSRQMTLFECSAVAAATNRAANSADLGRTASGARI